MITFVTLGGKREFKLIAYIRCRNDGAKEKRNNYVTRPMAKRKIVDVERFGIDILLSLIIIIIISSFQTKMDRHLIEYFLIFETPRTS